MKRLAETNRLLEIGSLANVELATKPLLLRYGYRLTRSGHPSGIR
jgi:hypothetical protein